MEAHTFEHLCVEVSSMNIQNAIYASQFVQFIANSWKDSNGNNRDLDNVPVVDTHGGPVVSGKNYTVFKTIYACDLATDFHKARPGEGWKTMGIVAQNAADPNDVVISIRGTLTIWEWLQDGKFLFKPFSNVPGGGLTEDGFTDMYQSFSFRAAPNETPFMQDLLERLGTKASVIISGHSLGGALAQLMALDFAAHSSLPLTVFTIASPRAGDLTFSRLFDNIVPACFRVANRLDIVPKTPPPLFYFHVGDETELVPGTDLKFDLGCEHHLTSYLNMLAKLIGTQANYPIQPDCLAGTAVVLPTVAEPSGN
jgi:triacylglycerol lipase